MIIVTSKKVFKNTTVTSDSFSINPRENVEFHIFPTAYDKSKQSMVVYIECTHDGGKTWNTYLKAWGEQSPLNDDFSKGFMYGLYPLHDKINESCQVRLRIEVTGELELSIEGGVV